jgi:octaprenyl-diphosphate synthase
LPPVRATDDEHLLLELVEQRIREVASSAPPPVGDAALHLITAGGKRVRPMVLLHAAGVGPLRNGNVVDLAAAAELVHNASLLHDDVIDEANLRRGRPTSRTVWGNAHSVLAGDHLMAAALELLEASVVPGVLRSMLATMRRLVAAEVVQLAHRGKLLPDIERYEQVIRGKTAALFSGCADAGARAGGADEEICRALTGYGEEAGMAFQLFDDLLDLSGTPDELGKSMFNDIAQGVATLPVVLAAQRRPELAHEIMEAARTSDSSSRDLEAIVDSVRHWVEATGAADETRALAHLHIERALTSLVSLGDRAERRQLEALAMAMINRSN